MGDAAARIQQSGALVGDADGRRGAARQMRLHLVGEMVDVDHRGADAGLDQTIEHVVDQRTAGHLHQRLRPMIGQRPHAAANAGREHHGGGGAAQPRAPAGAWRANQPFRPSRPGVERQRSR